MKTLCSPHLSSERTMMVYTLEIMDMVIKPHNSMNSHTHLTLNRILRVVRKYKTFYMLASSNIICPYAF